MIARAFVYGQGVKYLPAVVSIALCLLLSFSCKRHQKRLSPSLVAHFEGRRTNSHTSDGNLKAKVLRWPISPVLDGRGDIKRDPLSPLAVLHQFRRRFIILRNTHGGFLVPGARQLGNRHKETATGLLKHVLLPFEDPEFRSFYSFVGLDGGDVEGKVVIVSC